MATILDLPASILEFDAKVELYEEHKAGLKRSSSLFDSSNLLLEVVLCYSCNKMHGDLVVLRC